MAKRVFLVSSGRLCVYHCAGSVSEPFEFLADENGLTMFSVYLERDPTEPAYILVDVVEEEFRVETIPHVFGRDRRALINNRRVRLFRDAAYSHAIYQGREKTGRRDDRILFTALTRPEVLAPWTNLLAQHKVPLAGIYSLPMMSQHLIKRLRVGSAQALLVTLQSSSALRQTFFKEGQLKVSRLALLPNLHPSRYPSHVLSEVEKIRRYLNSLQLLPQGNPLDVYILGQSRLLTDIKRQAPDSVTTRYHALDIAEIAKRLGVRGKYGSPFSDALYAHLLAHRPPKNHYATPTQTRYNTLHRTRLGLIAASVLMLVGSLAWSGFKFVEGVITAHDAETVTQQVAFYNERYRLARERLPDAPADTREIQLAVDVVDTLTAYKTSPEHMMTTLSQGLADFPSIQLDRIVWLASTDKEDTVQKRASKQQRWLATRNRRRQPEVEKPSVLFQVAEVHGRIAPFTGDYRQAFALVRDFADTLRLLGGVEEVSVESLPLEIGSERRLSGDAQSDAAAQAAGFAIKVALRANDYEPG